jgi:hypothetical protein
MQPTRIEKLDGEHPGLKLAVDRMFDKKQTGQEVVAMLAEEYGLEEAESTVNSYKRKRYDPAMAHVRDLVALAQASREVYARYGVGAVAEAKAMERFDEIGAATLLREGREQRRLDIEERKVKVSEESLVLENKRLEVEIAKLEGEREAVKEAIGAEHDERKDPGEALKRIREIYGITQ